MIKNERQYRITKAQAERFSQALRDLRADEDEQHELHPRLRQIQEEALKSQLKDLKDDLREYETLKAGSFAFEQLKSVSELPKLLIRARIASGFSQRELAGRLGLKEQQIQRYEATNYASASLNRIMEVVSALGVEINKAVFAEVGNISLGAVLSKVSAIGLAPEFIRKRLLPRKGGHLISAGDMRVRDSIRVRATVEALANIFSWTPHQLLAGEDLALKSAIEGVRFKRIARANPRRVNAYTVYAHYLGLLTIQACAELPIRSIPTDPAQVRGAIESSYGSFSLAAIVNYIWDLGVVVLPLDDPGAFHGACFREDGRNVIVLKQKTSYCSRWAFDCLHEFWHAGQESDLLERTVLEQDVSSVESFDFQEEKRANRFAVEVLLDGKGQRLAEECLAEARGELRFLKKAVQAVASREGVPVDSLANYLAFRLADEQEVNWWGAANSLQNADNPWKIVRNVFFERADFAKLAEPDRELLAQALTAWEE